MRLEVFICRLPGSNFSLLAQTVQAVARVQHTYIHRYIVTCTLFYYYMFIYASFASKISGFLSNKQIINTLHNIKKHNNIPTPLSHKQKHNMYLNNTNLVCLFVRVFRSYKKSQHHEILAQCVIWDRLGHDEVRFLNFSFLRILWAFFVLFAYTNLYHYQFSFFFRIGWDFFVCNFS